jgi:hypothetical protein
MVLLCQDLSATGFSLTEELYKTRHALAVACSKIHLVTGTLLPVKDVLYTVVMEWALVDLVIEYACYDLTESEEIENQIPMLVKARKAAQLAEMRWKANMDASRRVRIKSCRPQQEQCTIFQYIFISLTLSDIDIYQC